MVKKNPMVLKEFTWKMGPFKTIDFFQDHLSDEMFQGH